MTASGTITAASSGIAARPKLYLNGKFYGGATNGVHRVADRLFRELDRLATDGGIPAEWDIRLLLPKAGNWAPAFRSIQKHEQRRGHSQIWEQAVLPFAAQDGVLVNLANLAPGFHGRQLTMIHDAQFRLSPESYPPKLRWGYRLLIPRGARASKAVLAVSDYARDSLATFGIASREKVTVLHNGGDHILDVTPDGDCLRANGLKPGKYALLFGATARYKNVEVVFSAFTRPALGDLPLAIIGPTARQFVNHGLRPPANAVFLTNIDDAKLRALYEGARCLLYPSRTEGFGLPPIEAMLCGCPVVTAPAGAIPEICHDAVVYAGMDDAGQWADAVQALGSVDYAATKICAGRTRAARFTWAAAGEGLVSAIAALMPTR